MSRLRIITIIAILALGLGACGQSTGSSAPEENDNAGSNESPDSMESEEPREEPQEDSEESMGSDIQLPPEGEPGSLSAMAQQPAGTAASTNPVLTTLTAAVKQAGLVDTLNSEGPFTIFAPVNDAFAEVPAKDLKALLADKEMLTGALTYHVVAGQKLEAADLADLDSVETASGGAVTLARDGDALGVNGQATTLMTDIQVSNGVVHLIDAVLSPQM